jgi:hypothetical protein
MAYFPHAYQKMLVATNGATPFPAVAGAATTTLLAGQVAVVNALTNLTINTAAVPVYGGGSGEFSQVYLAQGSFHTNDKIGPFHGGYKETVKSKGINPKYVSDFYVTEPANAVNNVIEVCQSDCKINCETMYDLRVDIKGSPALRFLNHNVYQSLSAYSGCCVLSGSNTVPDSVDPNVIFLQWADQINSVSSGNNSTPFLSQFINAKVWNATALVATVTGTGVNAITVSSVGTAPLTNIQVGNKIKFGGYSAYVKTIGGTTLTLSTDPAGVNLFVVPATGVIGSTITVYREITSATYVPLTGALAETVTSCMDIIGAYMDTQFGDCSFDPKDHFELEPLLIYASAVSYPNNSNVINGDPCVVSCFTVNTVQAAYQGRGYGETLVRELILAKRYQQEPWYQDPRMREVMQDTVLGTSNSGGPEIARGSKYVVYYLLHSVPRKANPSGTFDNDQYLIKVVASARNGVFETWWNSFLDSAGSAVQLRPIV